MVDDKYYLVCADQGEDDMPAYPLSDGFDSFVGLLEKVKGMVKKPHDYLGVDHCKVYIGRQYDLLEYEALDDLIKKQAGRKSNLFPSEAKELV